MSVKETEKARGDQRTAKSEMIERLLLKRVERHQRNLEEFADCDGCGCDCGCGGYKTDYPA
jgi:hypothetical protein